jgi:GntR family transcriptional regulator
MNILIKNKIDIPIYQQIKDQIKEYILVGELQEYEKLISIRQLARDLKISVITTTRAYSELEDEGYVYTVPGKGHYVAEKDNELLKERLLSSVEVCFEKAISDAKRAGLIDDEIVELLKAEMERYENGRND